MDYSIHVGALEQGLWTSPDRGESWRRARARSGDGASVRSIGVDPGDPQTIWSGSDRHGLYRSRDNGVNYEKIESCPDERQIWSVTVDPNDSNTIFVGAKPGVYRSRDFGKSWQVLVTNGAEECPIGTPRTTAISVDPSNSQNVWAGAEIDGVFKSTDGGDSWTHFVDIGTGQSQFESDVHCVLRNGTTTYAGTPFGLARTEDEGKTWLWHHFPVYHPKDVVSYCRAVVVKPDDPNVMYVANGDTIPGVVGGVQRTTDGGATWALVDLPVAPKSVIYWIAVNAQIPDVVVAVSLYGYVYVSEDAGDSWRKLPKEFGELRAVAVTPNLLKENRYGTT